MSAVVLCPRFLSNLGAMQGFHCQSPSLPHYGKLQLDSTFRTQGFLISSPCLLWHCSGSSPGHQGCIWLHTVGLESHSQLQKAPGFAHAAPSSRSQTHPLEGTRHPVSSWGRAPTCWRCSLVSFLGWPATSQSNSQLQLPFPLYSQS